MIRIGKKSIYVLAVIFTLCTCIDPYSPKLKGYDSILVVNGLLTNENAAYTITLSKTLQDQNAIPVMVPDASAYITDETGNSSYFRNMGSGIYKTDSVTFRGFIGRSYTLHITTQEGNEYQSTPCTMYPVPDIDSLYFAKDEETGNNGTEIQTGLMIYLDSKPGENNVFYRWSFDETWKFKVPFPKRFNYIDSAHIVLIDNVHEICWKTNKSGDILIRSVYPGQNQRIEKEPILFIASEKSDRLMLEYSILVKQYSLSKDEFNFWDNLKKVNESGLDIFASQPFEVVSNIHNIKNPDEKVLGYFQVSAVKQKRKYILFKDIVNLQLPFFHYDCVSIARGPQDYPPTDPPWTFDVVYNGFPPASGYVFVEPIMDPATNMLERLVFSTPRCANCELTGSSIKPDFWIDYN